MFSQLTRYASELDVQIDDANMDIRITYDTRGKLLLDDTSPAAQQAEYVLEIKSPASPERVAELVRLIEKGCHTTNTLREPTPVLGRLVHNDVEVPLEA